MEELRGRVAVVTGAASGIGRALAKRLGAEGMRVVLADVEPAALAGVAEELAAPGVPSLAVRTDVASADSVQALAERTLEAFGAAHVVCNNAGVFAGGLSWEAPLSDYEWVLAVNTFGVLHGIRSYVPLLLRQNEPGHIVNTVSIFIRHFALVVILSAAKTLFFIYMRPFMEFILSGIEGFMVTRYGNDLDGYVGAYGHTPLSIYGFVR